MMQTIAALERLNRWFWIVGALALLCGVGILDSLTGRELSLSLFYLVPIVLLTWFTDGRLGTLTAIAAAAIWLITDLQAGALLSSPTVYYWDTAVRLGFFLLTVLFLRLIKALERDGDFARTDYVTGVLNSSFFHDLSQREVDRSLRYGSPFTVAYLDIDDFKTINNVFGHMRGDEVLSLVAKGMQQHVRKTDTIARVGGDEFAVLFPQLGPEAASLVISNLQRELSEEMKNNHWPVTFSIGVMTFVDAPSSADEVLNMTDKLMYTVKTSGKNNINYATHTDPSRTPFPNR